MAVVSSDFDTWLASKIKTLSLDEEVYFEYIKGILEEEETGKEELKETLAEILGGVLESGVDVVSEEICRKWFEAKELNSKEEPEQKFINADKKIKSIIEQQQSQVVVVDKSEKLVDNEMKKLVLSQFQNCSDSEEETNERSDDECDDPSEFKNVNAEAVAQKQQQEREKQKKVSDEKKQRDKQNREKEKNKKEERQEKEKKRTQKGERKGGR